MAPAVQLANAIGVFGNVDIDDAVITINLPLRITMYNYSTSSIGVSSNGAEVEVNGQRYAGEDLCSSKSAAHQSAATKACRTLIADDIDHPSIEHLPSEYADIEHFIGQIVESTGGRIRKIRPINEHGIYRFEITGSYRYCENVHRHHKKNHIYFIVNPIERTLYQKCYDPGCQGFRSRSRPITEGQSTVIPPMPKNLVEECPSCLKQMPNVGRKQCQECAQLFCSQCV
ncbi:unnamed protein product [Rotaria sp. Silwood2]|nr:unnamed protein product [Rotaria sp. Silwood2]CAF4034883.1 unnamed protein product [Rotaria sp. Silwood2]